MGWDRAIGKHGEDWANDIQPTSDGGYIIAGALEQHAAGGINYWVIKLRP